MSAAAWHPDPTRRHHLRYWDGCQWTKYVVTGSGQQAEDPLPSSAVDAPSETVGPANVPEWVVGQEFHFRLPNGWINALAAPATSVAEMPPADLAALIHGERTDGFSATLAVSRTGIPWIESVYRRKAAEAARSRAVERGLYAWGEPGWLPSPRLLGYLATYRFTLQGLALATTEVLLHRPGSLYTSIRGANTFEGRLARTRVFLVEFATTERMHALKWSDFVSVLDNWYWDQ